MKKPQKDMEATSRLMGALVRMKPKPHEDMKIGKKREPAEADSRHSNQKKDQNRNSPKARG